MMSRLRRKSLFTGCSKMARCKGGVATNPAVRGCFAVRSDFCHADEMVRRPASRNREK
jgi:hypothetical protein